MFKPQCLNQTARRNAIF